MTRICRLRISAALALAACLTLHGGAAFAATQAEINRDVDTALQKLYESNPTARVLRDKARAILVFPRILKAGFIVGAQGGDGALREGKKTVGFYRTLAASYGFQAGIEAFGYAMFLMDEKALEYLNKSDGWEIGVGPTVVIVDAGVAKNLTSTTLRDDVYAVVFDQKGLMAGIGIQGSKITKISPEP